MSDLPVPQKPDPREMLRAMIEHGAGNSADAIMLRLLWLRQEHPQAVVTTDALHIADDRVVMRAAITLQNGAAGSGIAAASIDDGGDWADIVERTETIAISRALDTLGYVLRAAGDTEVHTPTPEPELPGRDDVAPPAQATPPVGPEMTPAVADTPRPSPRIDETAPSLVNALRRANRPAQSAPAPATGPEDDAHLEEYSWNTFWSRARELGLTPEKVTEALGQPAARMTPKEAVAGLIAAGAWPQPDEG